MGRRAKNCSWLNIGLGWFKTRKPATSKPQSNHYTPSLQSVCTHYITIKQEATASRTIPPSPPLPSPPPTLYPPSLLPSTPPSSPPLLPPLYPPSPPLPAPLYPQEPLPEALVRRWASASSAALAAPPAPRFVPQALGLIPAERRKVPDKLQAELFSSFFPSHFFLNKNK